MTVMTTAATDFSPVAEAERIARLDAAARLLENPVWSWQRAGLLRAPREAVARHLDGVLNVLIERGWTQDQFWDETGAVCLLRALSVAAELGYGDSADVPLEAYASTTYNVANRFLDLMVQVRTGRLGAGMPWNDEAGRTAGEVLELVADAAAFARSYV
jgi:hypothetical protein